MQVSKINKSGVTNSDAGRSMKFIRYWDREVSQSEANYLYNNGNYKSFFRLNRVI